MKRESGNSMNNSGYSNLLLSSKKRAGRGDKGKQCVLSTNEKQSVTF